MRTVLLNSTLHPGLAALVDDTDYELVLPHKWHPHFTSHSGPYARAMIKRPDGSWGSIGMHKLLTGWRLTDHINRDGLDNRRANLRPATTGQNVANSPSRRGTTSQYKGVSWRSDLGKWRSEIKVNGIRRGLGVFAAEIDAARAYQEAAREAWGEYAYG